MSLLQMSLSGAVLILVIMGIRAVAVNRLPKMTFVILWEIVILRLLLPFSFSSVTSVYTLLGQSRVETVLEEISNASGTNTEQTPDAAFLINSDIMSDSDSGVSPDVALESENETDRGNAFSSVSLWTAIWLAGMLSSAAFFAVSYERSRLKFSFSLPVQNEFAQQWFGRHWQGRSVSVRQSDLISAPLTYGIIRPAILMPKETNWKDIRGLEYIFTHECMHIRRFDAVRKLVCVLALCVHWFNPLVWVMYFFFNRDIELACDERVIRSFGETSRKEYSMVLIGMETKKSGLLPFYNHFSKGSVEERITAIMKTRKMTAGIAAVSVVIVAAVIALFVTSPGEGEGKSAISAVDETESSADSGNNMEQSIADSDNGAEGHVTGSGGDAAENPAASDDGSEPTENTQTGQSAGEPQIYQTITVDGFEVSIKDLEPDSSWQITVTDPETGQETKILELAKLASSGVILQRVGEMMSMQTFLVFYTTQEGFCTTRYYFGILDGECLLLGEGGGYGDSDEYILDVDGDGVTELICNEIYSDGVQVAVVYQWDGEKVLVGGLDGLLTEEPDSNWLGSCLTWYLPEENVVEIRYWKNEGYQTAKYEIDLSRIKMYEYNK
ncbi:MAG: M56 family metallopeptidase [Lachnospiraceae bacterium]|nr:M56 family metallopeptidase [Lachnospiraceae bacterium]